MSKKALFLAALFLSEIGTLAPIISLKHADFLVLIGNAVLGSVWFEREREKIGDCPEWRSVKPYIGLFRNYWRFHAPIDEITSKGSSCSLFATRAVSSNSYAPSCR